MNIVIREAVFTDLRSLAELFDLYRQFYEQEPDLYLASQFLSSRFKNSESTILVAEVRALADGKARMDLTTAAQSFYESLGWQRDEVFYAFNKQPEALVSRAKKQKAG